MPQYDAFGRPIGEDPLAALRDATGPVAEPVEAPEPAPVAPAPPVSVRPRRRRRRGYGWLIMTVALFGVTLSFVGTAVDRIESGSDEFVIEESPALGPDSMIREANLTEALKMVQGTRRGRPLALLVTPSRVEARLVAGDGERTLVVVERGAEPRISRLRARGGRGIPYRRIDAGEPERLVSGDGRLVRAVVLDRDGWRAEFR